MAGSRGWKAVMKRPLRRKIEQMGRVAAAITAAMALVVLASAKNNEKVLLPDYVLKAQTVVVLILPDTGEPMNDPFANRMAQEEVEKAIMKWGRFRLMQEAFTADLVIGVRKGTGKIANPTISGVRWIRVQERVRPRTAMYGLACSKGVLPMEHTREMRAEGRVRGWKRGR
jgi:hypothetical protein